MAGLPLDDGGFGLSLWLGQLSGLVFELFWEWFVVCVVAAILHKVINCVVNYCSLGCFFYKNVKSVIVIGLDGFISSVCSFAVCAWLSSLDKKYVRKDVFATFFFLAHSHLGNKKTVIYQSFMNRSLPDQDHKSDYFRTADHIR